jgi:methylglutaconyl-CoA hydratase
MAYEHLISRRDGAIEHLTLNRPEVRNAFNAAMVAELADWARATAADAGIRAVVIAGAGPTFCAGADLGWMARTVEYTEAENVEDAVRTSQMFGAIDRLPHPVIGKVHGAAFGGGAGLAAVCDIVVAEEHATFGFTEVKLGIIPAVISPFVLAKIGRSAARELFITGRRFSAQRALEIGLVHAVVADSAIDDTVDALVGEMRSGGPQAITAVKQLVAAVWSEPPEAATARTAAALAKRRVSREGQHGLRAFLEKRKPDWSET